MTSLPALSKPLRHIRILNLRQTAASIPACRHYSDDHFIEERSFSSCSVAFEPNKVFLSSRTHRVIHEHHEHHEHHARDRYHLDNDHSHVVHHRDEDDLEVGRLLDRKSDSHVMIFKDLTLGDLIHERATKFPPHARADGENQYKINFAPGETGVLFYVKASDSVHEAIKVMTRFGVGSVLVVSDKEGKSSPKPGDCKESCESREPESKVERNDASDDEPQFSGIFTTRDFLHKVVKPGLCYKQTTVSQVMNPNPANGNASDPATDTLKKLLKNDQRHILIFKDNKLIGLLGRIDLVKKMYKDYLVTTEYLLDMVGGKYPA